METLSYVLADNGFTHKARLILHGNWERRPSPVILHARMKLAARQGHGRARLRLVESAMAQGVEPCVVDKMHAAALALRSGAHNMLDAIDPRRALPVKAFPAPQIIPPVPKVALCLSGHMRGFTHCAPSIHAYVVDHFNADVFISTWDDRGISVSATQDLARILPPPVAKALAARLGRQPLSNMFPALTRLIEKSENAPVTEAEIENFYTPTALKISDEAAHEREYFTPEAMSALAHKPARATRLKMYYQLHICNGLKIAQEAKMGGRYDVVIHMRPDLRLTGPAIPETESFGFDVYSDIVRGHACGEHIYTSSSANMDVLGSTWARAMQVISGTPDLVAEKGGAAIGMHGFVAQTLWSQGLAPRMYEKPFGTTLVDNALYFPDTAQAMLRDMATWPTLDDGDITCIANIFNALRAKEGWKIHIPALMAFARASLPEIAMQKVTV